MIQQETTLQDEVVLFDDGPGLPDDKMSDGSESGMGAAQSMESVQETETVEDGAEETMQVAQFG